VNPHEYYARLRKAQRLVTGADVYYAQLGVDPIRQADLVALALEQLSPEGWRALAVASGQRPPSLTTQRLVVDRYRERSALLDQVEHLADTAAVSS
jgi:hypothetical protein